MYLQALDCAGSPAPHVSFSLTPADDDATQYYGDVGQNPGPTTVVGNPAGGFVNVLPGIYRVTATRQDMEEPQCVVGREVITRANAETNVVLLPGLGGCP